MAHMIDESNGRFNMAYVGEVPWHREGNQLAADASIEAWAKASGMEWEALVKQAYYEKDGEFIPVPDRIMLIRNDTGAHLGSFTNNYQPTQPKDVLAFFNDFVLVDDQFTMETAGCLKGGAVIWALAKFREDRDIVGESHRPYMLLTTSFDGSMATIAQGTCTRVVCNNTLSASIFDKHNPTVRIRHDREFKGIVAEQAHEQLSQIAKSFDAYEKMAETLIRIRMSRKASQDFLKSLITPVGFTSEDKLSTRSKNSLAVLYKCLDTTLREGTERDTAWATFNAVTRYVDHEKSAMRTNGESTESARMASSFFGTGAAMKSTALERLLEMAD